MQSVQTHTKVKTNQNKTNTKTTVNLYHPKHRLNNYQDFIILPLPFTKVFQSKSQTSCAFTSIYFSTHL